MSENVIQCPKCSRKLYSSAVSCPQCGHVFRVSANVPDTGAKPSSKGGIGCLLAILYLVGSIIYLTFFNGSWDIVGFLAFVVLLILPFFQDSEGAKGCRGFSLFFLITLGAGGVIGLFIRMSEPVATDWHPVGVIIVIVIVISLIAGKR